MKKYNWVAQDKDGEIRIYENRPNVYENGSWWEKSRNISNVVAVANRRNPNWKESLIDLSKNDYIIKDGILMATRKHAALIHAWVDGAVIQSKCTDELWYDLSDEQVVDLILNKVIELRIKPKTRTVTFKNYHIGGVMGVWVQGYQGLPGSAKLIDRDWQEVEIEL